MNSSSYRIEDFQPVVRKAVLKNFGKPKPRKKVERPSAQVDARTVFISVPISYPSAKLQLGEPVPLAAASSETWLWDEFILSSRSALQFTTLSAALPRTEYIATLGHPLFTLRKAIPVVIELQEGIFSAWSSDIRAFGYGPTELDAIEDFRSAVVELYEVLAEKAGALGPDPARTLLSLEEFIEEKS